MYREHKSGVPAACMIHLFKREAFVLTLLSALLLAVLTYSAFISEGCEGGMDSYNHYLISKFSWKHPELLLDQWGKPLYNILASPFAQSGFLGVEVFNILLLTGSAWMVWLTARTLQLSHAWLGFLVVLLPQESIQNSLSGLTEFLNTFLLALFLYLAASKRWNMAAALAGLLPFARSEGFVLMAVAGFYLLFVERKYKSLIWFLAGPVLFNMLGWWILNDPLWIVHNPYIKAQVLGLNICGSGSLFHYAKNARYLFSVLGTVLLVCGTLTALIKGGVLRKTEPIHRYMLFLVSGMFWLYFGVHSFIWWKGMMGSCGYTRVMIVITPLAALLGVYAWNEIIKKFPKAKTAGMILLLGLALVSAKHTYSYMHARVPYDISEEQKEFNKVAQWLPTYDYKGHRLFFLYPYLNILLDLDPYNKTRFEFLWSFDFDYSEKGSILIWDAHFGPNECQIPLQKLMNNPDFVLVKSFYPDKPFPTLNQYPFEIHVFKRVKINGK